ncbi:MAG: hypothetical protein KF889_01535 [Alphaproteobacteria bacterium]|nr:hypothetical protein [Alphaproteobacteria bacterium]MCW5741587.1 hypothetical protein [Alphaproteobacteria bacterium]
MVSQIPEEPSENFETKFVYTATVVYPPQQETDQDKLPSRLYKLSSSLNGGVHLDLWLFVVSLFTGFLPAAAVFLYLWYPAYFTLSLLLLAFSFLDILVLTLGRVEAFLFRRIARRIG